MHKLLAARFVAGLFFLLAFVVIPPHVLAQESVRQIEITQDADYFGFDLRAEKEISLEQCKSICLSDKQCRAFTYNTKVKWCFLKSDFREIGEFKGAIAGKIVEIAAEADLGAPEVLSFLSADIIRQAAKNRRQAISAREKNLSSSIGALISGATTDFLNGDYEIGKSKFSYAIGRKPDDLKIWQTYIDAISGYYRNVKKPDYRVDSLAISVAVNAYQLTRTKTPRAKALAFLARSLERNSQYRPALEAYKKSLALVDSIEITDEFTTLRESKGFRITGNTVDTDTKNPRVCIQFSEPLIKSGVDYSKFMTIDAKPAQSVEASQRQICIEGLEHGKTYRVGVRSGVPSRVGEVLEKPAVFESYIRDRTATVRFEGAKFVLPSSGRHAIPIVSVNSKKAKMRLYRVGERALPALLANTSFLTQLSGYSFDNLERDFSELVWEGTIDLKYELNREVTTGFDVDAVLPQREPGIYILRAAGSQSKIKDWNVQATQWFLVSDIGLSSVWGDGGLTIFARGLDDAKPLANAQLKLLARNNEVLGTATTNEKGIGKFSSGLLLGSQSMAPSILVAKSGEHDFVFLDLNESEFDLSDRGVEGRAAPGPVDIFVYNDRGIYRVGESIHSVALMRDSKGNAQTNLPITFIYSRPDGVEAKRIVSTNDSLGAHSVAFDIPDNAMLGTWSLKIYTDPEDDFITEKQFLVEEFTPDRTEVRLQSDARFISVDSPAKISVKGRYLYGAPAAGLKLEGELRTRLTRTREGFKGYKFGLLDESNAGKNIFALTDVSSTDANGQAEFEARIGELPASTRPRLADVVVRMAEEGGKSVETSLEFPIKTKGTMIGVRPEFSKNGLAENSQAEFTIIAIDGDGNRVNLSGLTWSLYQIDHRFQWYRNGSRWNYESVEIPRVVGNGEVSAKSDALAKISAPVTSGEYRLDIESDKLDGPATSVSFSAGWFVVGASAQTPDALQMALNKDKFAAGETAILNVNSTTGGELNVVIGADKLLESFDVTVEKGKSRVEIPVKSDWGAGAYVTATLVRAGNKDKGHMPVRAIGTIWLQIDPEARKLDVNLQLPEKIRPNNPLDVAVKINGLGAGETAFVTVAAVDVGILNLTRYQPPQPSDWFYGQRAMGLEIRDIYGRLIDGSKGDLGKLRSGGDGPGLVAEGKPPTEKLLSFFSGIVKTDENGVARISFNLGQFNGTARVMAVAWNSKGVGAANSDVIIRDPIVVSASLPKVMAPGDKAQAIIAITNADSEAGDFSIAIGSSDNFSTDQSVLAAPFSLKKGERKSFVVPISANLVGKSQMKIVVKIDGESVVEVAEPINIRPATLPITTRTQLSLVANNGSLTINKSMLEGNIVEGAKVSINMSTSAAFDIPALLMKLNTYPYGCAEQTTSKALPLLYLTDLDPSFFTTAKIKERVEGAIKRVLSYQSSNGGFGLWSPGDGDLWLDAYVTDFLTRAVEKGFDVPAVGLRLALNNLQNVLGYENDIGSDTAYALYVLARNRLASASDLRYYADSRLDEFDSPLARAHLAAALSLYNDVERAGRLFNSAFALANKNTGTSSDDVPYHYGSELRDDAAMLVLASESRPVVPLVKNMSDRVILDLEARQYTSTQENAWLLLASRSLKERNAAISLEINGATHRGAYQANIDGTILAEQPLKVVNKSDSELAAVVTSIASPKDPLSAGGDGFAIKRTYYDLKGNVVQLNDVHQNDRFVVVLEVERYNHWRSQIVVTDLLPGGFEIDNPRIVKSAQLSGFEWLGETELKHTEFRSDRFVAAFNEAAFGGDVTRFAYMVRAVTPGTYSHPAAIVEDMYRPKFQARTAPGFLEVKPAR